MELNGIPTFQGPYGLIATCHTVPLVRSPLIYCPTEAALLQTTSHQPVEISNY